MYRGHLDFGENENGVHVNAVKYNDDGTIDMEMSDGNVYKDCKIKSYEAPEMSGVTTVKSKIEKIDEFEYKIDGKVKVKFYKEGIETLKELGVGYDT